MLETPGCECRGGQGEQTDDTLSNLFPDPPKKKNHARRAAPDSKGQAVALELRKW